MTKRYVTDTNSLIYYFHDLFGEGCILSQKVKGIFEQAFNLYQSNVRLSIPSVVFLEIYEKWFRRSLYRILCKQSG